MSAPDTKGHKVRKGLSRVLAAAILAAFLLPGVAFAEGIIVDHTSTRIDTIPVEWIKAARENLHIAYGHTSHGSQLVTGMEGLVAFKGSLYSFKDRGSGGALDLRSTPMTGNYPMPGAKDLGNPNRTAWAGATRKYLQANRDINVVVWSWCGQVTDATAADIDLYLNLMDQLEKDFPRVRFVYMTCRLDATGPTGNLHLRNEQIRSFCRKNNKVLYDFADIETWDPDGVYYGDRHPNDGCYYDGDGPGKPKRNWAIEWQNRNPGKWYDCVALHTQPLNANLKAYAAWWLWARLAGWNGRT